MWLFLLPVYLLLMANVYTCLFLSNSEFFIQVQPLLLRADTGVSCICVDRLDPEHLFHPCSAGSLNGYTLCHRFQTRPHVCKFAPSVRSGFAEILTVGVIEHERNEQLGV